MATVGNYNDSFGEPGAPFQAPNMLATHPTYGSGYVQHLRSQMQVPQGYNRALAWKYNVAQGSTRDLPNDAQHFESQQPGATRIATPDMTSTHVGFKAENVGHPRQQQQQSPTQGYSNSAMGNTGDILVLDTVSQASPGAVTDATDDGGSSEKALIDDTWDFGAIFLDIQNGSLEMALQVLLDFTGRLDSEVTHLQL
ncbi:hypothetical protein CEP54_013154 [Fusarium duplospermum]|uniref:Uncharacterized protein n=1 Tax=Fusarium duplospermum TaxID=1325734 RepID=A0A428P4P6_9HYPO|nr:hypothetical protein CEP54_013154 [Fusarium duplospermum]